MAKVRTGPNWQRDLHTLRELRAQLPDDVELMVDGSETYTVPTALELARQLADLGVRWFEEPVPQSARAAIKTLAARSPVPIAYGEHLYGREDALDALSAGVTVLQPDASISGGIAESREIAHVAAFHGARVVPHVCAGPVSLAANITLAATVASIRAIEYPLHLAPAWSALGTRRLEIVDGAIAVPDGPGLGIELVEQVAAEHPYRRPGARVAGTVAGLPDRFVGDR